MDASKSAQETTTTPTRSREDESSPSSSSASVQLRGRGLDAQRAALAPGNQSLAAQQAQLSPVQMQGGGGTEGVHAAAARGTAGSGSSLPQLDKVQQAFGHHDVTDVQAYTGGAAAEASSAMGAEAFATGNKVAFGSTPSLHTVAHEAAHVVQQRSGVSLSGGVGAVGDSYEQHADKVADAVVSGQDAAPILDSMVGGDRTYGWRPATGQGGFMSGTCARRWLQTGGDEPARVRWRRNRGLAAWVRGSVHALLVASLLIVGTEKTASSAVPLMTPTQGMLRDNAGALVTSGSFGMEFALYVAQSGGDPVWSEAWPADGGDCTTDPPPDGCVVVVGGVFEVTLGSHTPLDPAIFRADTELWLGMRVEGDDELPRRRLGTNAFSFHAASASAVWGAAMVVVRVADNLTPVVDVEGVHRFVGRRGIDVDEDAIIMCTCVYLSCFSMSH